MMSEQIEEREETLDFHKSLWLAGEKAKIPLKKELNQISKKQRTSKKFFQAYMEEHNLSELSIGEELFMTAKTTERVLWNEDLVSDIVDDPSTIAEYKTMNRVVKTNFGVKRKRTQPVE